MKKKKLTLDTGNLNLSDEAYKQLLDAMFEVLNKEVQTRELTPPLTRGAPPTLAPEMADQPPQEDTFPVEITVSITDTEPGRSEVIASYMGEEKKRDSSGTLKFDAVSHGKRIAIQGKSLGKTEISFDVVTIPKGKTFPPGTFYYTFKVV